MALHNFRTNRTTYGTGNNMKGSNMTVNEATAVGRVVAGLLAYRGWTSPEKLANSFTPRRISGTTVRRIIEGTIDVDGDELDLHLMRLAGMLRVPPRALVYARHADVTALRGLDFDDYPDGSAVQQFIASLVEDTTDPPRNRRASDKKRASR